jgi:hypothetical protein
LAGLKKATRPYAIKIRTDSKFITRALLDQDEQKHCARRKRIFAEPVISAELYSRNPRKLDCTLLFHPSDFFFFGLTTDLLDLWDIPLYDDAMVTKEWETWRYAPEQYLWVCFLNKHGYKVCLKHCSDFSFWKAWQSEQTLMSNLAILSEEQLGVKFSLPNTGLHYPHTIYTNLEWQAIAQQQDSFFASFIRAAKLSILRLRNGKVRR